jgi:hypothetical protein
MAALDNLPPSDGVSEHFYEVERWCVLASRSEACAEDDGDGTLTCLVAAVKAFALDAMKSADNHEPALAFLSLVTELWGHAIPAPASHQGQLLERILVDALAGSVVVRELACCAWQRALRSISNDAERIRASLRAVIQLQLKAAQRHGASSEFWDGPYVSLVAPLSSLVRDGHAGAHVRRNVLAAVSGLHDALTAETQEPLSAPRLLPLQRIARALASSDTSPVVRTQALTLLLELEPDEGAEDMVRLLRVRANDKSPQVRAVALGALCRVLNKATASVDDLRLVLTRGAFAPDLPKRCVQDSIAFLVGALTDSARLESPSAMLAQLGMARAVLDIGGQGGGGTGLALFEALFREHRAGAVFNAIPGVEPALEESIAHAVAAQLIGAPSESDVESGARDQEFEQRASGGSGDEDDSSP